MHIFMTCIFHELLEDLSYYILTLFNFQILGSTLKRCFYLHKDSHFNLCNSLNLGMFMEETFKTQEEANIATDSSELSM